MRILVLCKRRYTGKDLLQDRFGRLCEIPQNLSDRGHEVQGIALDYHRFGWTRRTVVLGTVRWLTVNALPLGLVGYSEFVSRFTQDWPPDVIWASSDMIHLAFACRIGQTKKIPVVVDLYDNYESFGAARLPGLTKLYYKACEKASGISVVSHSLASLIEERHGASTRIGVVVNGVDKELFRPRDKHQSRAALGLPIHAQLIGTAGSLSADRGIADMFDAFERLAGRNRNLWLVFAGPRDRSPSRYKHNRLIDLGELRTEVVPLLFSALDVAVICNKNSSFGRYCFPMKFHEILACNVPVVAASVGEVGHLLASTPNSLYQPGNAADLASKIELQLTMPQLCTLPVPSWSDCTQQLEGLLETAVSARQ